VASLLSLGFTLSVTLCADTNQVGSRVAINPDGVLVIDGQKVFPIGFTMPPPPEGKAPNGQEAIAELSDAGATFLRTGAMGGPWDEATIEREQNRRKGGFHQIVLG
jgi:hypothetical protein